MVHLSRCSEAVPGLLLDDGAPCSGLGLEAFIQLFSTFNFKWNGPLGSLPESIESSSFWQYGNGSQRSVSKRILESLYLNLSIDQGHPVTICHLFIEGSSPYVTGPIITKLCDIIHRDGNFLQFENHHNAPNFTLVDKELHSYIETDRFCVDNCLSIRHPRVQSLCDSSSHLSFHDVQEIVDRVHKIVCGHSIFQDICVILKCNKL